MVKYLKSYGWGSDKKELEFSSLSTLKTVISLFRRLLFNIGHTEFKNRHHYCHNVSRFLTNFLSPENSIISMSPSRTRFSIMSFRDFVLDDLVGLTLSTWPSSFDTLDFSVSIGSRTSVHMARYFIM